MSFPELLRQCRKQKHMSQAELASLLGVTQQAVGKWESGKSSPDPTTVAKLAEILDTTADYLLVCSTPPRRARPKSASSAAMCTATVHISSARSQGELRRGSL